MRIYFLVLVLVLSSQGVLADKAMQIDKFFSIFTSNCSMVGTQTREAKATVDSFINVIKSIEADPECRSLAGIVNDLSLVSQQLQYLDEPNSSHDRELMGLENKKRELFLLLSQNLSDSESQLIQAEIKTIQLEIAEYRGYQNGDFENETVSRRTRAAQSVVAATNAIFSRVGSSQSCWINHPGLIQNVSSVGLAVGQSLAFGARSPDTALFLGAGLNLISNIVEYFHRRKIDSQVELFTNGVEATALTCAMETLSNQYCAAKDSEAAIELVAQALTTKTQQDPVWGSIRLLEREVPNMTEWLEMVMAGSSPSSSANARQRQEIYQKEEKMKSALDFAQGLIAEKRKFIDAITAPAKRWIEIRGIVNDILSKVSPQYYSSGDSVVVNPMSKRFSTDNAAYFLLGFMDPPVTAVNNGTEIVKTPIPFASFEPFLSEHAAYRAHISSVFTQTVLDNFRNWYKDTYEVLLAEKSRVLIDDPLMVFARAYPRSMSGSQKGLSPRYSLLKILEFLKSHQRTKFATPSLQLILADTILRLEDIVKVIDSVMLEKQDPERALDSISNTAKLDKGAGFLRARIEFFVKTILEEIIIQSANTDPKKLQLLAANDIIQYLKQYSGTQNLQKMLIDANNAQSLTSSTMVQFMETFKQPLASAMGYYDQLIRQFGERGGGGPHTSNKTVLCLNLATMPNVPSPISFSSCLGLRARSVFPNGPSSLTVQSQTMSMPFESRVCHYRDFHRRNAVFYSLLSSGASIDVPQESIQLDPTPVKLVTDEVAVIAKDCQSAEAWKTESNRYCEKDWWSGCDRTYAIKCEPTSKRSGFFRF